MTFKKWRLRQSKKGNYWVQGPSYSVENEKGEKDWLPYIEFSPEKKKDFERKVIEALKPFLRIDTLSAGA
jgi:hypothetical protein